MNGGIFHLTFMAMKFKKQLPNVHRRNLQSNSTRKKKLSPQMGIQSEYQVSMRWGFELALSQFDSPPIELLASSLREDRASP